MDGGASAFSRKKAGGLLDEKPERATDDLSRPDFKLEDQSDPLRTAIQKEAVELFEAQDYDNAGEKFYYLAEAAHHAGDVAQECTALQNMGTSLVMLGSLFEASRCYESAIQLAGQTGSTAAQIEVLESLVWVYSEMGNAERSLQWLLSLRELHMAVEPPDVEALCADW